MIRTIYQSDVSIENIEHFTLNKIKFENSAIFGNDDTIVNIISHLIENTLLDLEFNINTMSLIFNIIDQMQIKFHASDICLKNINDTSKTKQYSIEKIKSLSFPSIVLSHATCTNISQCCSIKSNIFTDFGKIDNVKMVSTLRKKCLTAEELSRSSYMDFTDYSMNVKMKITIKRVKLNLNDLLPFTTINETSNQELIKTSSLLHSAKQDRISKQLICKYGISLSICISDLYVEHGANSIQSTSLAVMFHNDEIQLAISTLGVNLSSTFLSDIYDMGILTQKPGESNRSTIIKVKINSIEVNFVSEDVGAIKLNIDTMKVYKRPKCTKMTIHAFEIIDEVHNSQWNKFLCHNQIRTNMLTLELYTKGHIYIKVMPLRLFIHQHTLTYLCNIVTNNLQTYNLIFSNGKDTVKSIHITSMVITIDYKPIAFNMNEAFNGDYAELVNLLPLQDLSVKLREVKITNAKGSIGEQILLLWYEDVKHKIPYKYLSSIIIINSLVTMVSGVGDIFIMPYNEYVNGQDGVFDVITGVSYGLVSFVDKLSQGCFDILSRITINVNSALETGQHFINPDVSIAKKSKFSNQPNNIGEGLTDAFNNMTTELVDTGNIIILPFGKNSMVECFSSITRTIPIIILKPISATLFSISKIMLGIKNNINHEHKLEMDNKYGT